MSERSMNQANHDRKPSSAALRRLFYPKSVALVGASERSPWSHMLHANLKGLGFDGRIYAVNKTGAAAHGYPGYRSCTEIPEPVDAAYLFVPVEAAVDAFADVLAAGIKATVILTSGFSEIDEAGAKLQAQLVEMAREADAIFLGPNCLGFSNLVIKASLTPAPNFLPVLPPKVGLVSQSGATNAQIADMAHDMNLGISLYIATGNEAMLDIAACVDFLIDDPHTRVVMVFAESIRDTETFAAAARRARVQRKAIVVLKVGTSELTAQVAAAHTGSLVGNDSVFEAVCRDLGIIRVRALEELLVTSALLAYSGPIEPQTLGVVSISGGACTLIADRAETHGVEIPAFRDPTRARLREALPYVTDPLNPFDITGAAMRDPSLFEQALRILGEDPGIGFILAVYEMPWNEKWHKVPQLEAIGRAMGRLPGRAATVNHLFRPLTQKSRDIMAETGIPAVFGGIETVLSALGRIFAWSRDLNLPTRERASAARRVAEERPVGELRVLGYLASYGVAVVPARLAQSADEAVSLARQFSGPCALKIVSPDIAHKTDVGGVALNVTGDAAVRSAYESIIQSAKQRMPQAAVEGISIAPMRRGGLELLVGTFRDPLWGPVITVGLGGIWTEVLNDTQLSLLPVTPQEVESMLLRLRGAPLLRGFRGSEPADIGRLAHMIERIGEAALDLGPDLVTLEINPLFVRGSEIEAIDALTVWSEPCSAASAGSAAIVPG
ncbi:MAG: acetate--CoA ligase family protein [Xanthobacteraceae bacterium]